MGLSSFVQYGESCRLDYIRLVRSRVKGRLVLAVQYEESSRRDFVRLVQFTRKEGLTTFILYEESSTRDFVPVRSRTKGELVLIRLVRGIKQAGLRLSVM